MPIVTQSLQFMLEVDDDEEWLTSDTAEDDDDNTRYTPSCGITRSP